MKTVNAFFNKESVKNLKKFENKTDVICAANVICHIANLKDLIVLTDTLLSSKGVFVFEEPYLGSMFSKVSYDQIYDEHIFMFSLTSIKKIFNLFDFDLMLVRVDLRFFDFVSIFNQIVIQIKCFRYIF